MAVECGYTINVELTGTDYGTWKGEGKLANLKAEYFIWEKKKDASSNYWETGDWEEQAQMGTGAQWHIIASGSWLHLTP